MPSYFITGASRGLGLAFAEKLLESPDNVVLASARDINAPGLKALAAKGLPGKLHLFTLDVVKYDSYPAVVKEVEAVTGGSLDYLLVNAGVDFQTNNPFIKDADLKLFEQELAINVVAPVATLRSFQPLLEKGTGKRAAILTTEMGSLTMSSNVPFLSDTYSVGKAAVNMVARKYGAALKTLGSDIVLLLIHPGWVPSTDLGAALEDFFNKYVPDYPKTPLDESITGVLKVIHESTKEDHTKFLNWKHEERPW